MKIEIYGADWCGFCDKSKKICDQRGIEYKYYDIGLTKHSKKLTERLGEEAKTVPQIFIDDKLMEGGYLEFRRFIHTSNFDE